VLFYSLRVYASASSVTRYPHIASWMRTWLEGMNHIPLSTRKALIAIFFSILSCALFVPILYLWIPEAYTDSSVLFLIVIVEFGASASVVSSLKIMHHCVFSKNIHSHRKHIRQTMANSITKTIEISVSAFWAAACFLVLMEKHCLQNKELGCSMALFLSLWLANVYTCATLGKFLRPRFRSPTALLVTNRTTTRPTLSQLSTNTQQQHNRLHAVCFQQSPDFLYPVIIGILRINTSTLKNHSFTLLMIVWMDTAFFG